MPCLSSPWLRASRGPWQPYALLACYPWWMASAGSGSGASSFNKLDGDGSFPLLLSPSHDGGGRREALGGQIWPVSVLMFISCSLPARSSSVRWPPADSQACCPWRMVAFGSRSGASSPPRISSSSSLIYRRTLCWRFLVQAAMVVDEGKSHCRVLKIVDRVGAHLQRLLRWSDGAGRLPVFIGPLLLLAERRPKLFLQSCMPKGRQFQLLFGGDGVQVLRPWRSRSPKWLVPGGDGIQSGQRG